MQTRSAQGNIMLLGMTFMTDTKSTLCFFRRLHDIYYVRKISRSFSYTNSTEDLFITEDRRLLFKSLCAQPYSFCRRPVSTAFPSPFLIGEILHSRTKRWTPMRCPKHTNTSTNQVKKTIRNHKGKILPSKRF